MYDRVRFDVIEKGEGRLPVTKSLNWGCFYPCPEDVLVPGLDVSGQKRDLVQFSS